MPLTVLHHPTPPQDEPQWHLADTDQYEDEGNGELYEFGQECLDRISISLGGNSIVPAAGALLPVWLQDGDWRKRHASLICLAQIAEGCCKVGGQGVWCFGGKECVLDLPGVWVQGSTNTRPFLNMIMPPNRLTIAAVFSSTCEKNIKFLLSWDLACLISSYFQENLSGPY